MSDIPMLVALQERNKDGLKMARVTATQAEILGDDRSEILCAGGNRGSKTFCAAMRFASIARDVPVQTMPDADGNTQMIHCRLKHQRNRPLIMWCIGDYLPHIGQVLYKSLFEPGLYYRIKDRVSGGLRAWNPVMYPEDWDREDEREESPPLIPRSEVEEEVWYHKNLRQFEKIKLKNGTEIFAFASSSAVKQGVKVDEIWLDENIVNEHYYPEWLNRLTDKKGRLFWSTIPRDESYVYTEVEERAEAQHEEYKAGQRKSEDVYCSHYILSQRDNPFLPESEKKKREEQMSERERMVRIEGVRSTDLIRIYQEFNPDFHCVEYRNPQMNDKVTEALRENNWEPPRDWTRYLSLDPGTQKPALLFLAVPPESMWEEDEPYIVPYDEIYTPRLDAFQIAQKVKDRHSNQFFEKFFIDGQAARQKPMGFSHTIGRQYESAFESAGLSSRHGTFFEPGDPSFHQRSGLVHKMLRMRKCGWPQLRILIHRCPHLVKQLQSNTRKLHPDGTPSEEPADRQKDDVRVALEYAISRHITYREPPYSRRSDDPALRRYQEFQKKAKAAARRAGSDSSSILCGVSK